MNYYNARRGTVVILGDPRGGYMAVKGQVGWRNVDTGEEISAEEFNRLGWQEWTPKARVTIEVPQAELNLGASVRVHGERFVLSDIFFTLGETPQIYFDHESEAKKAAVNG